MSGVDGRIIAAFGRSHHALERSASRSCPYRKRSQVALRRGARVAIPLRGEPGTGEEVEDTSEVNDAAGAASLVTIEVRRCRRRVDAAVRDGAVTSIIVVMVMMVPWLAVEPALAVVGTVAVIPMRAVDDDVVVVAVVVAVDVNVAAPVEVTAVVLGGRGSRSQDQAGGDQGWDADAHGTFLDEHSVTMGVVG